VLQLEKQNPPGDAERSLARRGVHYQSNATHNNSAKRLFESKIQLNAHINELEVVITDGKVLNREKALATTALVQQIDRTSRITD
jgi:hypothetical protein